MYYLTLMFEKEFKEEEKTLLSRSKEKELWNEIHILSWENWTNNSRNNEYFITANR